MKYLPTVLMLLAFGIICFGAFLFSRHNPFGLPLMIGGMITELLFIVMNRMLNGKKE
jgi:hypothetical protein